MLLYFGIIVFETENQPEIKEYRIDSTTCLSRPHSNLIRQPPPSITTTLFQFSAPFGGNCFVAGKGT